MCSPDTVTEAVPRGRAEPVVVTVVDDADGHERAVRGASVQAFRMGRGVGPNITTTREGAGFAVTSVRAGFPMASRATSAPDRVYAITALAAPPGSRWCDRALSPGELLFYGPEVKHTALNPVGVHFAFAAMDRTALRRTAETMGRAPNLPGPGEISVLPAQRAPALVHLLESLTDPTGTGPDHDRGGELLRTAVGALADSSQPRSCRRIDSGALVLACLDYAEQAQHVPSIDELCAATFVCRRKLWNAFDERYRVSPARFFRMWGLAQARARLQGADPASTTVLQVADDLGFHHAGRFASRYAQMFGEPPSQTLRLSA